jgi:hypothetical protein
MTSTEQKFYALLLSIEDKLNQVIEKDKQKTTRKKTSGNTRKSNVVSKKSK